MPALIDFIGHLIDPDLAVLGPINQLIIPEHALPPLGGKIAKESRGCWRSRRGPSGRAGATCPRAKLLVESGQRCLECQFFLRVGFVQKGLLHQNYLIGQCSLLGVGIKFLRGMFELQPRRPANWSVVGVQLLGPCGDGPAIGLSQRGGRPGWPGKAGG